MMTGHTKQRERLEKFLDRGAAPQALLFSGPEHIGKMSAAQIFAHAIVQGYTEIIWEAREGEVQLFGDLLLCAPTIEEKKDVIRKKAISVEDVREHLHTLALSPRAGAKKVLLIDDAELMTPAAQNALLKTLEEPTETSHIILVAHNRSAILPTLRSRCTQIAFGLVDDDVMRALTADETLLAVSAGRPGVVQALIDAPEELSELQKELAALTKLADSSIATRFALAEQYAKNMPKTFTLFDAWVAVLRAHAHAQQNFLSYENIARIGAAVRMLRSTNANPRFALENLFLTF